MIRTILLQAANQVPDNFVAHRRKVDVKLEDLVPSIAACLFQGLLYVGKRLVNLLAAVVGNILRKAVPSACLTLLVTICREGHGN